MSDTCDHCGQRIQQAHKELLTRQKLTMLKAAADLVIGTQRNEFKKTDIQGIRENTAYGNFQKLRYHGLITPTRDRQGNRLKGHWLITRNGWAFLRGELSLPKYVLVKNNRIETHSDTLITVQDVYFGSEAIQTTFEYFDEHGNMVGYLPVSHRADRQVTLI